MLTEVLAQIERRNRFVLTSHARADGDAVGSSLACCEILRDMGKQAEVVLHDGVPRVYRQLPFADKVIRANRVNGSYDAAVILECDSIQRTRLEGLDHQFLINIDHHKSGRNFAHVNWIDPKAVATAEMVYRLARHAGVKISPEIATCLYTAVLTDTGAFMFEGTNEHTFELARELVLAGADPVRAARPIYFGHSTAKMRLLGSALKLYTVFCLTALGAVAAGFCFLNLPGFLDTGQLTGGESASIVLAHALLAVYAIVGGLIINLLRVGGQLPR